MDREVYQEIILDHYRDPRNKVTINGVQNCISIRNPNCGDVVKLLIDTQADGALRWVHDAQGCAASVASASIMCEYLSGLDQSDATSAVERFLQLLELITDSPVTDGTDEIELHALLYFRNVPARKLCVSLAWTCAKNALAAKSASF